MPPYHSVLSRLGPPRLGPKKALSPSEGVACRGRIMAHQSAEQIIPLDFAEAFADAVLVYEIWNPEYPEHLIRIGPRFYSILEVCGFVDQFTDRLPERVFLKLRSYMRDYPDGILWADLAADPSYATAVRCLRKIHDGQYFEARDLVKIGAAARADLDSRLAERPGP
jgi:hypothetical protein